MAESTHGGARTPTARVKNLLAKFENGGSPAPVSPKSGPSTRESSPGPKPLGKVRTSFVAIPGKEGQTGLGLQRVPSSPENAVSGPFEPGPPISSLAEEMAKTNAAPEKSQPAPSKEPPTKKTPSVPKSKPEEPKPERASVSSPGKIADVVEAVPRSPTLAENVPPPKNEPSEPEEKVAKKTAGPGGKIDQPKEKAEKPKEKNDTRQGATKKAEPSVSKASKSAGTKNLAIPTTNGSKVLSPVPSPKKTKQTTVISRKPSAASLNGATSKPKPESSKPAPAPAPAPVPVPVPSTAANAVAPKPRQVSSTTTKKPAPTIQKPAPRPEPKETTKPASLKGSAFAPTASWAAKHGRLSGEDARPSSVAGNVRTSRSPASRSLTSDRPRSIARSPGRTAKKIEAVASKPPAPAPSSDVLSRLTRPTKASASKVHEKVEPVRFAPPFRAGSAAGRHTESPPHSPPWKKTTKTTAPTKKGNREPPIPEETNFVQKMWARIAPISGGRDLAERTVDDNSKTRLNDDANGVQAEKHATKNGFSEKTSDVPPETTPSAGKGEGDLSVDTAGPENLSVHGKDDGFDEGATPTTTSSQATLVHEDEGPEIEKVLTAFYASMHG